MERWIGEIWESYRGAVRNLYEKDPEGGLVLSVRQLSDNARLEQLAELSESLTDPCLALMHDGEEGAETALLAAAAVDATVAADVLLMASEREGPADPVVAEVTTAALAEWPDQPSEQESLEQLLAAGDAAFLDERGIGGSAPAEDARQRAQQAIDDLVERAAPVARNFGTGMITFGAGDLVVALAQVDLLRGLAESAEDLLRHGLRLMKSALRKLIEALGGSASIAIALEAIALGELVEALRARIDVLSERSVRTVVRASTAESRLDKLLPSPDALGPSALGELEGDLDRLCKTYAKRMKSAAAVRRAIRIAAPVVTGAATGGIGFGVIGALNGAGLAYVLYSLAVRLDTAPSIHGGGVVELVEQAL
jgi:hypothetical protein